MHKTIPELIHFSILDSTALVGPSVKPGISNNTRYTHYDLLRTIEDNFQLGNLGREDAKASDISGIWQGN